MKNILLVLTLALQSPDAFSQTTKDDAIDFIAADIAGDTLHLFEILNEGQFVYINFFRVDCAIDDENVGKSEVAFNYFGCNGGDVFFLGVNTGNNKSEVADFVDINNINYPVISGIDGTTVSTIFEDYDVQASPTFILIAPSDSIIEQNIWLVETEKQIIDVLESQGITETAFTVGINEVSNADKNILKLFPNPATDNIQLSIKLDDFNNVDIRMFDIVGKEVLYQKIDNATPTLSIQDFPAGIYFIALLNDNQPVSTKKLIIKG
jgi:hypothetical protein